MKIIIAGAGEVGRHLAKMLSNEKQDIVLMDSDPERIDNLDINSLDLMTNIGQPTSINDLKSCGIKEADLFIAVTTEEATNITACMIAHNLGAKKTVARIDNYEYLLPANKAAFEKAGIDSLIYPEVLAAKEIIQSLKRNWTRELRTFDNALTLVCVKVRESAEIINHEFKTGYFDNKNYRIVAIFRNNETIIPSGNDQILADDIVYFICPTDELDQVRKEAGKERLELNNLIIMGGSRIAIKTIQYLADNIHVKVIESNKQKCYELADKIDSLIINGDGRDFDLLKEEGIEDADAFITLTSNSEANIMACMAAKRFGIRKTIAEVENMNYINLANTLDIGTIINKKLLAASHIYQMTLDDDALSVTCLTYSDAKLVEFIVEPGDRITKKRIKDLRLPTNVNLGGIIRDGKGYTVSGNTVVQPGDHVVLFCMSDSIRKISKFFNN